MHYQIRLKIRLLPYLMAAVIIMQLIDPSRVWTALLVTLGGIWLSGWVWIHQISHSIALKRELRYGWVQVGDILEERFTLTNTGLLPVIWIAVQDHSQIPGYRTGRITQVESQNNQQWKHANMCSHRGLYTLGPTSLLSADPFGVYEIHLHYHATTTLLVVPPVVPLPAIEVAPGGRAGDARPKPHSLARNVSAAGVRIYTPGDSLRDIHWPTTARKENPYIRLRDDTPSGDWLIVLDAQSSIHYGAGWESTMEHAIVLGASLADRGLRQGKAVGLAVNSQAPLWLPPRSGEHRRWEILRALALAEVGDEPVKDFLFKHRSVISPQSSLILITTNTSIEWLESLLAIMRLGTKPTVLILDRDSFGDAENATADISILAKFGLNYYLIPSDYLDQPEARPGKAGRWEWKVTALGRSIPVTRPDSVPWRPIS